MSSPFQRIAIGADHAGFRLKEYLKQALSHQGIDIVDFGCPSEDRVDYPAVAETVGKAILSNEGFQGAILCCGSGIGMAMAANRFPFLRAVVANDLYSAKMSRLHNDANVLCLGGRFIAPELAEEIAKTFFGTAFEGGRHQQRVNQLTNMTASLSPTSC